MQIVRVVCVCVYGYRRVWVCVCMGMRVCMGARGRPSPRFETSYRPQDKYVLNYIPSTDSSFPRPATCAIEIRRRKEWARRLLPRVREGPRRWRVVKKYDTINPRRRPSLERIYVVIYYTPLWVIVARRRRGRIFMSVDPLSTAHVLNITSAPRGTKNRKMNSRGSNC